MKRFSIVMAAYNSEKEIEKSINSVLMQTFKNYEFIVVNDASTDNTGDVIKKFHEIKLINHEENKKAGGARNTGIENANGEYIIFLDSDDILADKYVLEKIDKVISGDTPDIVYLGFKSIGTRIQGDFIPNEHNSIKENRMLEWKYENVWDVCWRRDFLNKNKIRFVEKKYYEDFVFYYQGLLKSESYKYTDFISFIYTCDRPDSMTTYLDSRKLKDLYFNINRLVEVYDEADDKYKEYVKKAIKRNNDYAGRVIETMK